jgi:hypothetical protein
MIVNAYAVLDAFLSLLRLGLSVIVVGLGFSAWWQWLRYGLADESRNSLEDRCYLLFLLAGLLLALNVLAWPLFYLLLQSYVPEWPGVMCIYGVTRIGTGSLGPSRFLPTLVTALQVSKPALVFASGAWFVIYLVNRSTATGLLTGKVLVLVLLAGMLAVADASAEIAYLVIPKKEVFLSAGCCTVPFDDESQSSRNLPDILGAEQQTSHLYGAYYVGNGILILVLAGLGRLSRRQVHRGWLALLLVGAVMSLVVNGAFLVEVAAPRLLHLPYHHCPYDLVPQVPESVLAVALFVAGAFAVGWACVAAWLGKAPETQPFLAGLVARLLFLSCLAYLGSLMMMSLELALA